MRVFAISDLHIDYKPNKLWLTQLSRLDHQEDLLILAGDVSDDMGLLEFCFEQLDRFFSQVLFVPGNHELWVRRQAGIDSIEKFHRIQALAKSGGIEPIYRDNNLNIVPLYSWYDFSFGAPSPEILQQWMDFTVCRWPEAMTLQEVTLYFLAMNQKLIQKMNQAPKGKLISYSHFLPRIDLIPDRVPLEKRFIDPVLGSKGLGNQVKNLQPDIHVYGHSHINRQVELDGIQFINNAYGYPTETNITQKRLVCIHES